MFTLQRGRIEGHGFVSFPRTWAKGRFTGNRQLAGDSLPGHSGSIGDALGSGANGYRKGDFNLTEARPRTLPSRSGKSRRFRGGYQSGHESQNSLLLVDED